MIGHILEKGQSLDKNWETYIVNHHQIVKIEVNQLGYINKTETRFKDLIPAICQM